MCGRYVAPASADIERLWRVDRRTGDPFARRANVAPTSIVPILLPDDGLVLTTARWGLVPHWWQGAAPPRLTFNARAEEAAVKPMWRAALKSARCLVPAEGWYEWRAVEHVDPRTGEIRIAKQPYFLRRPDCALVAFAGLYAWQGDDPTARTLSCAILTTDARDALTEVHDRMPVVLDEAGQARWLDAEPREGAALTAFAQAAAQTALEFYPLASLEDVDRRAAAAPAPGSTPPAQKDLFG